MTRSTLESRGIVKRVILLIVVLQSPSFPLNVVILVNMVSPAYQFIILQLCHIVLILT